MAENSLPPVLSCEGLACTRQGRVLFERLGFSLLGGGVLLLVGRNGCGKTTLIKRLAGLLTGDGGVYFKGAAIAQGSDYAGRALYLGHLDAVKPEATVYDHLAFWAELAGEKMLLPAALRYFGLETYREVPCALLSAGWRKRVALARLLVQPAALLWLLDEPYTHLDDASVRLLGGLVESHARRGGAAVIAAHHLPPGALGGTRHPSVLTVENFARGAAETEDGDGR